MASDNEIKKNLWETLVQFIKFGIVGGINTILTYAIVNGLYYFGHLHYGIGTMIAFIITVFISYVLNSKFAFKQEEGEKHSFWKALLKVYISYSATALFLTWLLLYLEVTIIGIPLYIATIMNYAITIPTNFLMNKYWAYRKK